MSGLPEDVTPAELAECLKVAGVLKADPDTGEPRIKLYHLADGTAKGDALVSFLKPESVALAVTLRDGSELRAGVKIGVQPAKFEKRDGADVAGGHGGGGLGRDQAIARKRQRILEQRQLAEWETGLSSGKRNTTVVLTGLFDATAVAAEALAEGDGAEGEAAFYANLRQDVEVECRKAGGVEKVTVFEGSEKGAVAVRFKDADDAERCAAMMDARSFGASTIRCQVYDGVTDYRALNRRGGPAAQDSRAGAAGAAAGGGGGGEGGGAIAGGAPAEDVAEQEKNLDAFADWLEAASTDSEAEAEDDDEH